MEQVPDASASRPTPARGAPPVCVGLQFLAEAGGVRLGEGSS